MKFTTNCLFSIFLVSACTSVKNTSSVTVPYDQDRFLIITADDFGASKNINEGIELAADKNAITAISALTNFSESLPDLKRISEKHPDISIGAHLNITTGRPILCAEQIPSLVNAEGDFYTINELLSRTGNISTDDLRKELRAQIIALENYNIRPDHLSDQYGILSLYNPFFDIILELATEFNVPVRSPITASSKYPGLFANSPVNKFRRQTALRFIFSHPFKAIGLLKYTRINEMEKRAKKLHDLGIFHPDLQIMSFWGDPTADNFLYLMEHLPEGTSEIVLHIGTQTRQENYPRGLDLSYFRNREYELITVTSDYLQGYMDYLNIKTIGYAEIFKNKHE
jgi:predicted glycoside hydrolase/deacetylase ChbG (UPF0249 family)